MLSKKLSVVLLAAMISILVEGSLYAAAEPNQATNKIIVSKVVRNAAGKYYIEVDGRPFLYNAVQSWYPPEQDYALYVEKTAEANYKCFTFWLYWKHLEPVEGKRDWTELDKIIDLANKYDVRLDIIWGGANFCGHVDPRFTPDWLFNGHQAYHIKDPNGKCVVASGFDMGNCCAADLGNDELLGKEKKMLSDLLQHLRAYDKNHRVIAIQIENEANIHGWLGGKAKNLAYINALGQVVKQSNYEMVTRVNLSGKKMDNEVDKLQYIDGHGPDPYDKSVALIRDILESNENTRFKYIAENAAYENSTSLIITALAEGGFYNIYRLDYDSVWNKPGVYDKNFQYWEVTYKIKNLNKGLNKMGSLIAQSPKNKMVAFNTEMDYPSGSYKVKDHPSGSYKAKKILSLKKIGFESKDGSKPVGIIIENDNKFYCVADDMACLVFESAPQCEAGYFDASGKWIKEVLIEYKAVSASEYQVDYKVGDCMRVVLP